MANFLPRIEWKNITLTGDTNSNTLVDGITSTTGVEIGMFIEGTGIPTGTTVSGFTSTTITLSQAATATASGVSLSLGFRFDFSLPPEGDNLRQRDRGSIRRTLSNAGVVQNQFNYIEETISANFVFLSSSEITSLETFFQSHALEGSEFRYYEHNDESTFFTVSLSRFDFSPRRVAADGSGGFIHDLPISMRRTL